MQAQAHHARYGAAKLEEAGSSSEFVTRTIKKVLDEEMTRLENGLPVAGWAFIPLEFELEK
jgi:biopolymer transport protein ExbB